MSSLDFTHLGGKRSRYFCQSIRAYISTGDVIFVVDKVKVFRVLNSPKAKY